MKTTPILGLSLLLAACGDNSSDDHTGEPQHTGDVSMRLAPDAPRLEAERSVRAAPVARGASGARARVSTGADRGPAQAVAEGRVAREAVEVVPSAPRLAPLPAEPTDEELAVLTISTDSGADGTIDRVQRSWFDSRSNRVMLEEDRDGDGVFEIVEVFFHLYDDDGRLFRIETDRDADGTIDAVENRSFNAMGRALRVEHDTDGDGAWDKIEHNTWDDKGRKVEWAVDEPVDGQFEMVQTWSFGPDGQNLARSLQRYSAGKLVSTVDYGHTFGEDGRVTAMQVDGPQATNEIFREYDDRGRLTVAKTDTGRDGTIDSVTSYTYDDAGRLVELLIDAQADGAADTRITRTYENFARPSTGGCN